MLFDRLLIHFIFRKLTDLEKIRQSFELFSSVFPLAPNIWLDWLKIESSVANETAELKRLAELFHKALKDYYSADIALEFAGFTKSLDPSEASAVWKELLSVYIYDYNSGTEIFKLWRVYYDLLEPE